MQTSSKSYLIYFYSVSMSFKPLRPLLCVVLYVINRFPIHAVLAIVP